MGGLEDSDRDLPDMSAPADAIHGLLVTATAANHFAQLHGLVSSAQRFLPQRWRIVIYDLIGDLSAADVRKVRVVRNIEVSMQTAPLVHGSDTT